MGVTWMGVTTCSSARFCSNARFASKVKLPPFCFWVFLCGSGQDINLKNSVFLKHLSVCHSRDLEPHEKTLAALLQEL